MKLEVGMYVRTKQGTIEKVIDKYEAPYGHKVVVNEDFRFKHYEHKYIKHITKASHNIIDLIEKNDFVNGEKVSSIQYEGVGFEHIKCVQTICKFDSLDNQFYTETYFDKDIKIPVLPALITAADLPSRTSFIAIYIDVSWA